MNGNDVNLAPSDSKEGPRQNNLPREGKGGRGGGRRRRQIGKKKSNKSKDNDSKGGSNKVDTPTDTQDTNTK